MIATAADDIEETRPYAAVLVEHAERRLGSRMSAYAAAATDIGGVSDSWVRKLVGRQRVAVYRCQFKNVVRAYVRLCERIEAEADIERQRMAALRRQADAALASDLVVVARTTRAADSGEDQCKT